VTGAGKTVGPRGCRPSRAEEPSFPRLERRVAALQLVQFRGIELHLNRRHIVAEVGAAHRPGDQDDVLAMLEQPGQGDLRRRAALRVAMSGTTARSCMSRSKL